MGYFQEVRIVNAGVWGKILLFAALAVVNVSGHSYAADATGIRRTELERSDVPGSNFVVVTTLVEIDPGITADLHTHPGVEIGYVLSGSGVLTLMGQPDRDHSAGHSFQVPAGTPHKASNPNSSVLRLMTIFIVERDKPLRSPAK